MTQRTVTIILMTALLISLMLLMAAAAQVRPPGNQQGYSPQQPIAFSHRLHAGELGINCTYCHATADKGKHAGIAPLTACMSCHQFVQAPLGAVRAEEKLAAEENREPRQIISPELRKLYDAWGLDDQLQPAREPEPVEWVRIHNLPDFAYFNHAAHVNAGVSCQTCHGPVETMERVRQEATLSMGWCLQCHRTTAAADQTGRKLKELTNCKACHF